MVAKILNFSIINKITYALYKNPLKIKMELMFDFQQCEKITILEEYEQFQK